MNIDQKMRYALQAIESITSHDDAPFEEVRNACSSLKEYIDGELGDAKERRDVKEAANAKEKKG